MKTNPPFVILTLPAVINFNLLSVLLSADGNYIGALCCWALGASVVFTTNQFLMTDEIIKHAGECLDGWKAAEEELNKHTK